MERAIIMLVCIAISVGLVVPMDPHAAGTFSMPDLRPLAVGGDEAIGPWGDVKAGRALPAALAQGDFDEDGVPDLVAGYTGDTGNFVTLQRGNVDALFPHSPGARQRRAEGTFTDQPFLTPATAFDVPVPPDFLGVGDFDNDGNLDVVVGPRGIEALCLMPGDGEGGLKACQTIPLSGELTAMTTGEINRRDGLTDLVVGVRVPDGFELLVFESPEGALRSTAEVVPVPAEPTALLLARLGDGPWWDLAAAAGDELIIVRGRDRQLVVGEERLTEPEPPVVESFAVPATIESLAWGEFTAESGSGRELALLLQDGTIRLLDGSGAAVGRHDVLAPRETAPPTLPRLLLPVRVSGEPGEDLAVFDAQDRRLSILAGEAAVVGSLDLRAPTVAALPMRLNRDALTDLVLLQEGVGTPVLAETASRSTIVVDSATDNAVAGDSACTLREAMSNANADADTTGGDCTAGAGVDSIDFLIDGGGAPATIALQSALPVITDAVTIDGTTQACASPPCIVLNGAAAGYMVAGLNVAAGPSSLRGLVIQEIAGDNADPELHGHSIFMTSSGNFVEGVYCGTDLTGMAAQGNNAAGVRIEDGSNNTIGGTTPAASNVLSASVSGVGVFLTNVGTTEDNLVLGNFIGTDVAGTNELMGNYSSGMAVNGSNNTVGGTSAGARNLISGNAGNGIYVGAASAEGILILGNYIGTDVDGTAALGNGENHPGVWVNGTNHTIGGTSVGARNIISGNPSYGVYLPANASANSVIGNYIGTDITGTADLGNGVSGVRLVGAGGNNVVGGAAPGAGNLISANGGNGVSLDTFAYANQVLGNFIGTDVSGTTALGNAGYGVSLNGVVNNVVGGVSPGAGNLISANGNHGVYLLGEGLILNQVLGNRIGTDVTGTAPLGNGAAGVRLEACSNNIVGGAPPGAGNLISANGANGVVFIAGASANQVLGNFIGTDVTGTAALGNGVNGGYGHGVFVYEASDNVVGGTSPGAGNLISGNLQDGIQLWGNSTGNQVLGNLIGTDVTGMLPLGNAQNGLYMSPGASNNVVGGTDPGAGNLISGNGLDGIFLRDGGGTIAGNLIGTDLTGAPVLGNGGVGIEILDAGSTTVGGTSAEAANLIAGNALEGVSVEGPSAIRNAILGNAIFANGLLGIDLEVTPSDGITPNDLGDGDAGPNGLQNFPFLESVEATPAEVTIAGGLNSRANNTYRVELYASTICDDSGYGEGERFLGFTDVTTDIDGNAVFDVVLGAPVSDGDLITTTATDLAGNTSEFCGCVTADCLETAEFGTAIVAQDQNTWIWGSPQDIRYAKGELAGVGSYATTSDGTLFGVTSLDMSMDLPATGDGLYYLVRPLGCGSWQTAAGAEPERDAELP